MSTFSFQNGSCPVHYAASHNQIDVLYRLQELGADILAADKVGYFQQQKIHHMTKTKTASAFVPRKQRVQNKNQNECMPCECSEQSWYSITLLKVFVATTKEFVSEEQKEFKADSYLTGRRQSLTTQYIQCSCSQKL